ncbi:OprD family outer membrane porin [Stenotrophomonas oahuensis]|uniref:OprD family outer membrane porin n=1 Tax=Stenotrophomonas oahuensis TaxID=3003271 RepID=A0ABY9YMX9_9GAMM|nr:OprD family outer membrane porin [Stenotrophomonas sp. A5586]WNH52221.1 OprD family outer membrane porin [Stenotrophomonas sp. A5586]
MRNLSISALAAACLASGSAMAEETTEGFFKGAEVDLTATNFYYNRDFRSGSGQGKREEWAQGLMIDARSGYTPGVVGFGLDLLGLGDLKLDGSDAEVGTGILPYDEDGARTTFGRVAVTGKAKAGPAELRVGSHITSDLTLKSNTSRLLPQTFEGASLGASFKNGLELGYKRFDRSWYRDGVDRVHLTITNKDRRFSGTPDSDHLDLFTAGWKVNDQLKLRIEHAELQDIYRQQVASVAYRQPLPVGRLDTELRYYVSDDVGQALAGVVDNRAVNALVTWNVNGQEFALAYQDMSGDTAMPFVGGTDGNVFNWTFINDFMERDERSWQARYQLDGKRICIPGLKFLVRYVKGDNARPNTFAGEGRQWQRDFEIGYTFQSEALKDFSIRWRNGFFRSNYQRDAEENRLMLVYSTSP